MIPKVIHYCWFSGEPFPPLIKECLSSWKRQLADFTFKEWNATMICLDNPFARKAFREKKWAFLTDYFRLKILYEEGGIFMDTDMFAVKSLNELLDYYAFWSFADNGMVEPVVIGTQKGNEIVHECMKYYSELSEDQLSEYTYQEIPKIITPIFIKKGLQKYQHENQVVENNIILKHTFFCPMPFQRANYRSIRKYTFPDTFAVHLWNAAWVEDEFRFFWNNRWAKGWTIVAKKVFANPFMPNSYYKSLMYHLLRQLKLKR